MKGSLTNQFIPLVSWRFVGAGSKGHLMGFLARIAMFGLVLSVCLLIIVLSVMNGFDREMRERILAIVPHLSIHHQSGGMHNWRELKQKFQMHPEVVAVSPFSEHEGMLKAGKNSEAVVFYGESSEFPLLIEELTHYLSEKDKKSFLADKEGVLIGAELAKRLQVDRGDFVLLLMPVPTKQGDFSSNKIISRGFHVNGFFNTGTEIDKTLVILHHSFFIRYAGQKAPTGLRLKLRDLFHVNSVQWDLLESLSADFYGRGWSKTHGNLYDSVQMSRAMVSMLMYIIIAVAVFNVVSTLVLAGFEKRQAIAILRVQGATRLQIAKLFIAQGALIGLIGAGIGAVLGVAISMILPGIVQWAEMLFGVELLKIEVYPIDYIPSDVRPLQVIALLLTATFFSIVASFYPAWRAAQIQPAQVLRYE